MTEKINTLRPGEIVDDMGIHLTHLDLVERDHLPDQPEVSGWSVAFKVVALGGLCAVFGTLAGRAFAAHRYPKRVKLA